MLRRDRESRRQRIEARGGPTLLIGTVQDIMLQDHAPCSAAVDLPLGRTFGRPNNAQQRQQVVASALDELASFTEPGQRRDLPSQLDRLRPVLERDGVRGAAAPARLTSATCSTNRYRFAVTCVALRCGTRLLTGPSTTSA